MGIRNLGLSMLSMLAIAAFAPAQASMGVSEGLTAGGNAVVTYSDPNRANDVVIVEVDNGVAGQVQFVEIQLDGNGNGSADWEVPGAGWFLANFTAVDAPDVRTETRAIALPPPSPFF